MKKILSVITSAVLCFSAAAMPCVSAAQLSTPVGVVSENKTDASGTCGTNVSWTLSGGTLTISGSGKMVEWQTTKYVPWNDHMSEIRKQSFFRYHSFNCDGNFSQCFPWIGYPVHNDPLKRYFDRC